MTLQLVESATSSALASASPSPNSPSQSPASMSMHLAHVETAEVSEEQVVTEETGSASTLTASPQSCSTLQDLKTQVDRRGWRIRWEENKLSEQEFRARVILDMGNEDAELPWSGVYLGLKRAKQAAAELALASMTRQLVESATSSALASASPLPSSPSEKNSAVSSPTWSGSALQDLKTVMDRQQRSFRWEEERVSEQVWRARIVLPQPGGHDSVLAWSEPCLGLKKAKQAAAAIALGHVNQSISP